MSWFAPTRKSVTPWCGSFDLGLTDREGQTPGLGVASVHVYSEHVAVWRDGVCYGSFDRAELASWLRVRRPDGPVAPDAAWQLVGVTVALMLNGVGIHYLTLATTEWMATHL